MKKILVTCSDEFIGSHLVKALVLDGFCVPAFVIYNLTLSACDTARGRKR